MEEHNTVNNDMQIWNEPPFKKKTGTVVFVITVSIFLSLIVIKTISGIVLGGKDITFRSWVELAEMIILRLGLPIAIVTYIVYLLMDHEKENKTTIQRVVTIGKRVAIFLLVVFTILYVLLAILIFALIYESSFEREEKVGTLLRGSISRNMLDSEKVYRYYDKYQFLTKRICNDYEKIISVIMNERYEEGFVLTEFEKDDSGYIRAQGFVETMPELPIAISAYEPYYYAASTSYRDDREMAQSYLRMQEYIENNNLELDIRPVYSEKFLEEVEVYCTYEELEESAENIAGMVSYILQDNYFEKEGCSARINIICGTEINAYNCVQLGFGNYKEGYMDGHTSGFFSDYQNVYDVLEENFKTPITDMEDLLTEEDGLISMEEAEKDLAIPEGAYKKLYDTVFADQGKSYECTYNAKGNFYGILGTGEEELSGVMRKTRETVVYDRESKNGECQLFVQYKEYLQENENEISVYSTAILEFYAVNMETGEVTAAGKTSWQEVGSKEYRDRTGE